MIILSKIFEKGLDHPNIVLIKGLYEFEDNLPRGKKEFNFLIVMELAKCSLDDVI